MKVCLQIKHLHSVMILATVLGAALVTRGRTCYTATIIRQSSL